MIWPGKLRIVFKVSASLIACIFLWQQISWAGDLSDNRLNATLEKLDYNQTQTFAPDYLQTQQAIHEDLITQKQAIEDYSSLNNQNQPKTEQPQAETIDLLGPRGSYSVNTAQAQSIPLPGGNNFNIGEDGVISITTEAGDVMHYKNGTIYYIEMKDGTVLRNITLDQDNKLVAAEITYVDGTIQIVSGGKTTKITKPDGTVYNYNEDEMVSSVVYPDGSTTVYTYVKDASGKIIETILTDAEKTSYYDEDGRLERVVFRTGKVIEYSEGILSKVIDEDGRIYIYETTADGSGDDVVYIVKLAEMDYGGNKYYFTDNNITSVELSDGTTVSDFQLDGDGKIVGARIEYSDGTIIKVENRILTEITSPDGVVTRYTYSADKLSCEVTIDDHGSITKYTYTKDAAGRLTIDEQARTYEYDALQKLQKFTGEAGAVNHLYDAAGAYIGSKFTLKDGTVKEYGPAKNIIRTTLPDGTVYEYYQSGAFSGMLQKIIYTDGKKAVFEYKIADDGKLQVYKRLSYDKNAVYQTYYQNSYISYTQNPSLKTTFRLDGACANPYIYAMANYYQYNDKSVNLYLNIVNGRPYIYYSNYNYLTQQWTSDAKALGISINKNVDYIVEYMWTVSGINVYVYESAKGRPAAPLYRIADNRWNPRFYIYGNSANIRLDPSSSGTYMIYANASTNSANPLGAGPIHTTEFKFYQNVASKYFYYYIYGRTSTSYDYIYLTCYGASAYLTTYHYDYVTRKTTYNTIPLAGISFNSGKTYQIQARVENGKLQLFISEKGLQSGQAIYTLNNVSWSPQIYSNISGGEISVEAYDNLQVSQYNESDTVINDPYKTMPGYFLVPQAPLTFPDGKTDILGGRVFDLSLALPLPGDMFSSNGSINHDSIPTDLPYFNVITYDKDKRIAKIVKPGGDIIKYKNGLVDEILDKDGNSINKYDYQSTAGGSISEIIATDLRNDIVKQYDATGKLKKLSVGGVNLTLHNNVISRVEKEDGTLIEDASFDEFNNIVSAKITSPDGVVAFYSGGVLREIHQPDGNVLYYDEEGNILNSVNESGVHYNYVRSQTANGTITIAEAVDPEAIENSNEVIYKKYDEKNRVLQLKLKNGKTLDYTYNEDASGNLLSTIINDGVTATTYDQNNNIIKTEVLPTMDDPLATVSEYEYGRMRRVYKGGDLIYRYSYEFDAAGKEITVIEDVKTGDMKRYKDELLISVTDKNSIVTYYEYDAAKKISKSTVKRYGKIINVYIYTYENDLTIMEDSDGVKRSYDKDNKLKFLEENGRTYEYSYSTDSLGKEVATQELVKIKDASGVITNYKNGEMKSILKPDGTVLKDIVITNGKVASYTAEKDGVKYFVSQDHIVKEVRPDGTVIEYYPSGWASIITDLNDQIKEYTYLTSSEASMGFGTINEGTKENINVINSGDNIILQPNLDAPFAWDIVDECNDLSKWQRSGWVTVTPEGQFRYRADASTELTMEGGLPSEYTVEFRMMFNSLGTTGSWSINIYDVDSFKMSWSKNGVKLSYGNSVFPINQIIETSVPAEGVWQTYKIELKKEEGFGFSYYDLINIYKNSTLIYSHRILWNSWNSSFNSKGRQISIVQSGSSAQVDTSLDYVKVDYKKEGVFTSKPIEINATEFGTISWNENVPAGTDITIQTRTGNTLNPDDGSWSAWSSPLTNPDGSSIASPAAKYIQYRAKLMSFDLTKTPQLIFSADGGVKISYLQNKFGEGDVAYIIVGTNGAQNRYDSNGRPIRFVDSNGTVTTYNYDGAQLHSVIVREFTGTKYIDKKWHYYDGGLLKESHYANGLDIYYDYNDTGLCSTFVAGLLDPIYGYGSYSYDKDDKLIQVEDIEGHSYSIIYNGDQATMFGDVVFPDRGWDSENIGFVETPDSLQTVLEPQEIYWTVEEDMSFYPHELDWESSVLDGICETSDEGLVLNSIDQGNIFNYYSGIGVAMDQSVGYTVEYRFKVVNIEEGNPCAGALQVGDSLSNYHIYLKNDGIEFLGADGNITRIYSGDMKNKFYTIRLIVKDDVAQIFIMDDSDLTWKKIFRGSGFYAPKDIEDTYISFGDMSDAANSNSNIIWGGFNYYAEDAVSPYPANGYIESEPVFMDSINQPLTLAWKEETPPGTTIRFQTSTSSSQSEDDWEDWKDVTIISNDNGVIKANVNSAQNELMQIRVLMTSVDGSSTPRIYNYKDDWAIAKLRFYQRDFDINAPPEDLSYRDSLQFTQPATPDTSSINPSVLRVPITKSMLDFYSQQIISEGDIIVKTDSIKGDILSAITLSDGTIIKYFNGKPTCITKQDGTRIDNIVLEKYNTAIYDYRIENGLLISYVDTSRDKAIVSFTAVNFQNDTYFFKDNQLVEIKLANGTIISGPSKNEFSSTVFTLVEAAFSPEDLIGDKVYKKSDISLSSSSNGKITYFINGKIAATYHRYEDGRLELLIDYSYDEDGTLILVRLPYARDSIENEIAAARQRIAAEKADYLRTLAEQKGLAYSQIHDQVESVRAQINAERARLQPMLYQEVTRSRWVGWWIFGWWETYTETVEVPEVRNALNQLNEQEKVLNEEAAEAYAQLDTEIKAAGERLAQDENASLAEVTRQEEAFHSQIIEEESTPVILEYYRSILGRDPDDAETKYWLSKVDYNSKIDVGELKDFLMNSPEDSAERLSQEAFNAALKAEVENYLRSYLNATEEQKLGLIEALGLTAQDAATLNQKEVDAIVAFLNKQNIHFGRSAFLSLEALLKDNNITYDLKDLATKAILVDIFTGTINSLSEGELLELSMNALSKVAPLYGLTLYNTKLNFDDLKQAFDSGGKVIAHLKNNHFVVVTAISADNKVSYVERNRGKNGYTWTVSKEEFENSWTGYTMTKVAPQDNSKILSTEKAQRIRGSCLPFLFPLIGAIIGAIAGVATVVVGAISAIVTGIAAVLGPIISGIAGLISGVAQFMVGIGTAVFNAVQFVGTSLLPGLGSFFSGIGSFLGNTFGLGGILSSTGFNLTALGVTLGKTVVSIALSVGISKGLEALGVSPLASNLISSFVTGGFSNLFNNFSPLGFIAGGIQSIAVQGVSELGRHLGIDPNLTSVISLASGALIGSALNNITPSGQLDFAKFSDSIGKQVLPTVAGELSYYGITKAGELLGVDPRISYLAGIGIRSSINAGLADGWTADSIWNGVKNGLLQGITSVGLQWAYDEIGVNPLFGAMTANAIGAAFEAILNRQNILLNIGKQAGEGIFSLFTLGGYGDNPWSQAVYISQVLDFSRIVQEQGLLVALETYVTSIFHQQTINLIVKDGGIYDMLTNRAVVFTDANGIQRKRLYADSDRNYYVDINMANNAIIEKKDRINGVDVITKQQYGIDGNGKLVLLGRTVEEVYGDNQTKISTYDDKNNLTLMEIFDKDGNAAFTISPLPGESSISLKDGSIYGCVIKDIKNTVDFTFENGKMADTSVDVFGADATPEPTYARDPNKTNLDNAESYLDSMMQDYNYRLSGEEIFGASGWEVAMRALLLTSSKFQITYGNEASLLQSSLSESERQTFDEYATFLMDSVINPHNYNYIPTADELAMWMALQSPIAPGSPYGFSLTVVHGMCLPGSGSGFDTTWADNIRDIKVGGQNLILTVNTWNAKGKQDGIDDGYSEFMDPTKRQTILDSVKNDIKLGWNRAQEQGIPFDLAAHSLGTVIVYEALRQLKTERPDIEVRNLFLMGSPLAHFVDTGKVTYDQGAFDKVTNVVNIYNPNDAMNLLRAGAVGAISQNPLLRILIQSDAALGDKPLSRELKPMFSVIKDYKTDVAHGAMWQDPKILRIVEESGIFNN